MPPAMDLLKHGLTLKAVECLRLATGSLSHRQTNSHLKMKKQGHSEAGNLNGCANLPGAVLCVCADVFMSIPICWPHVPPLAALNQSRSREAHSCVRGGELRPQALMAPQPLSTWAPKIAYSQSRGWGECRGAREE